MITIEHIEYASMKNKIIPDLMVCTLKEHTPSVNITFHITVIISSADTMMFLHDISKMKHIKDIKKLRNGTPYVYRCKVR